MVAKVTPFIPVIKMPGEQTLADQAAVKLVHAIHHEVYQTMDTDRNRKQTIGISEIGDPCDLCVAIKLALLTPKESTTSWKAQVGTFMHAGLEEHFSKQEALQRIIAEMGAVTGEIVPERTLTFPAYGDFQLSGSCDMMVHLVFADGSHLVVIVDWKTQGLDKLAKKTANGDIGETYTVQMHTYGLGYELQGMTPTHVLLYALPRDGELDQAKPVLMRYDRTIALKALVRITKLIDRASEVGWERVIAEQSPLREKNGGFCFGCRDRGLQAGDTFLQGLVR